MTSIGKTVYSQNGNVYIPVNVENDQPAIYAINTTTAKASRGVTIQAVDITGFGYLTPSNNLFQVMIKLFRKIHLWLSVPFGIIITLVCFSGAMLIFEPEITRAIKSDVYYVSDVKESPLAMGSLWRVSNPLFPTAYLSPG